MPPCKTYDRSVAQGSQVEAEKKEEEEEEMKENEEGKEKELRKCNYTNCKSISALFIAMYDIYPYYIYVCVCVSVLDANVSRRTSKKKQQRLMTLEE